MKPTASKPALKSTGFRPIEIPGREWAASSSLRYRVHPDKANNVTRFYLIVPAALARQVKPEPKFWRMDIDEGAQKGLLRGLAVADGRCKKNTPRGDKAAIYQFSWKGELQDLFPVTDGIVPLENAEVTTLGIVFDLPEKEEA